MPLYDSITMAPNSGPGGFAGDRAGHRAQQIVPHIGYVYPAGGRQGATFEVTVGGQFLDGVTNAYVSGAGVQARVVEHVKPLTPAQFNDLRDKLKELLDKRAAAAKQQRSRGGEGESQASTKVTWTAEDEKMVAEIREKIANFVRRPANPAIAETVTLQVTMAPDAEPGERELRLGTPLGCPIRSSSASANCRNSPSRQRKPVTSRQPAKLRDSAPQRKATCPRLR